jgi:hypothetical protein
MSSSSVESPGTLLSDARSSSSSWSPSYSDAGAREPRRKIRSIVDSGSIVV